MGWSGWGRLSRVMGLNHTKKAKRGESVEVHVNQVHVQKEIDLVERRSRNRMRVQRLRRTRRALSHRRRREFRITHKHTFDDGLEIVRLRVVCMI